MEKILNFDEDMQQVLYKLEEETSSRLERERNSQKGIQQLGKYSLFSLGKTSKELEEEGVKYDSIRELANDYNGPSPTYAIQHIKLLYGENFTLLGVQYIGEGNLERRYAVLKELYHSEKGLQELANTSVYGKALEEEMDILNLAAFYGLDSKREWISVEKIRGLHEEGAFFLDVREEEEHEYARILGSKNIPLRNLMARLSEIPKEEKVYIYCRSAHRSLDAVNFLKTLGYEKVYNMEGGFIALSYEEYTKDREEKREKILSQYWFE